MMATLTTGAPRLELGCGNDHDAQDTPDLGALMSQISAMMAPAESPEAVQKRHDDYFDTPLPSQASTSSSRRLSLYERSRSRKGATAQRDFVDLTKRADPFRDGDSTNTDVQIIDEDSNVKSDRCTCDECIGVQEEASGISTSSTKEADVRPREHACPNDGILYPTEHSILPARGPPGDTRCFALDYLHQSLKEAGAISRDPSPCRVDRDVDAVRDKQPAA